MRLGFIALVVLALTGCTAVNSVRVAVAHYCSLPAETRAVSREAVAIAISPNRAEIQCYE